MKKAKPVYAFAPMRDGRINTAHVRHSAAAVRDPNCWPIAKKNGWRVCKVQLIIVK